MVKHSSKVKQIQPLVNNKLPHIGVNYLLKWYDRFQLYFLPPTQKQVFATDVYSDKKSHIFKRCGKLSQ
jgi:hypothetical protein